MGSREVDRTHAPARGLLPALYVQQYRPGHSRETIELPQYGISADALWITPGLALNASGVNLRHNTGAQDFPDRRTIWRMSSRLTRVSGAKAARGTGLTAWAYTSSTVSRRRPSGPVSR